MHAFELNSNLYTDDGFELNPNLYTDVNLLTGLVQTHAFELNSPDGFHVNSHRFYTCSEGFLHHARHVAKGPVG